MAPRAMPQVFFASALMFSSLTCAMISVQERTRVQYIPPAIVQVGNGPGFHKAADMFRSSINETADPCEDFFEFSCGKWVANNAIPDDLTSHGHFSELREKVNREMKDLYEDERPSTSRSINALRQMYRGCMNVTDLNQKKSSELVNTLNSFGYWPIISNKWSTHDFDLTELLINIGLSRAADVFVDIYVSQDQRDVEKRMMHFDQGGLGLGSTARDYYLNDARYGKQLAAYERYIAAKVRLIADDANSGKTQKEIEADVKALISFEKEFAKILTPEEDRRNYTKMYNVRRFSDLTRLLPLVDWNRYFRALMPFDMHDYLNNDPEIIINEPEFFQRLTNLLRSSDQRVVANYILWRYTGAWTFQLDERFDDIQQDFLKDFVGKQSKSPRWKECNGAVGSRMSYASGAMYVRRHFKKEDRQSALEMIEDLREAFREMLVNNEWMEEETRKYALEKINDMQSLIGFPDFLFNDTALDEYYDKLDFEPNDDYATMTRKSSLWAQHKAFRRLREAVDRSEFGTSSAVVNAFYSSIKNGITFPAAILQPPFFDRTFPKAVNYGGIGAVIGHEMTHGFDDQGSQFDKIGNLKNWWDPKTYDHFLNRTQCIIDQYSSYEVPDTNMKINGVFTQGENIADNGGIKQAFMAYRSHIKKLGHEEKRLPGYENYSSDQIFFISYAQTWCGHSKPEATIRQILVDPHSPMRYRVNGVVVNQPEFGRAFHCPLGSKMNPVKKCSVW
jgi:membrane metallo-endopeptidase-like protein 1